MMKLKGTVRPYNLYIAAAAINVAIENNLSQDIVITSANDGKHMKNSKHYSGDALDIRSKAFGTTIDKKDFIKKVLDRLGHSYQGILEDEGNDNEHFHFEYDPS